MLLIILVILFLVGFFGDLILQGMARLPPSNQILEDVRLYIPFWQEHGTMGAAVKAGFITLFYGGLFLLAAYLVWRYVLKLNPRGWPFIIFATAVAYCLGVVLDVYTNRGDWLGPSFRTWYDGMGEERATVWSGGFAFAVTSFATLVAIMYLTKHYAGNNIFK